MREEFRTVEKTLRNLASNLASSKFKVGDMVEFIDDSKSPRGRIPKTLTLGKYYKVVHVEKPVIRILNDKEYFVNFYANRFRKIGQ